jgi:hypothetical protein
MHLSWHLQAESLQKAALSKVSTQIQGTKVAALPAHCSEQMQSHYPMLWSFYTSSPH